MDRHDEVRRVTRLEGEPGGARLQDSLRNSLARLADLLIPGGAGLPSASEADVHGKWIDRTLSARPDLLAPLRAVLERPGNLPSKLERVRTEDPNLFDSFALAVAGSYLMNPRVRRSLGYPGNAPRPKPAYPDEADYYLDDGLLDAVIQRGPIYRPTPLDP